MNRDLAIGIVFALLLHSTLVWWGSQQARPRPATVVKQETVRTVREEIELPKPPAPPPLPPREEPKPPPEPAPAKEAQVQAPARIPQARPRAPRQEAAPKAAEPKANNEPQPLVLSQTYGGSSDTGVAVQAGKDDVLGDPGVEANERSTRQRRDPDAQRQGPTGDGKGEQAQRQVDIVLAAPSSASCDHVAWPEGAQPGHRGVEVVMTVRVSATGAVLSVRILRSAGEPFDAAAVAHVKRCPFRPGTRDGKPVPTSVPFAVDFKPTPL